MRLGIISDIHSNIEALTSTYHALNKAGCDKIVCVGDIVGYGARPAECIDFIREKDIDTVKGNHDFYTTQQEDDWNIQSYATEVIFWTQKTLDKEHIKWLDDLPYIMDIDDCTFVHSSLEAVNGEYWPYILDTKSALFHFFLQEKTFAFFGHTHIPLIFSCDEEQKISIEILNSRKLEKRDKWKYLLNPGSVGQPRDFDCRSSSVIFNTETYEIEVFRVSYDIETVQKQIIDAGLPELLATRLAGGS